MKRGIGKGRSTWLLVALSGALAACSEHDGPGSLCLGDLGGFCDALEGDTKLATLDAKALDPGPSTPVAELEVHADCFERSLHPWNPGEEGALVVVEDEVWLVSNERRAVLPEAPDTPLTWIPTPGGPRFEDGQTRHRDGHLGFLKGAKNACESGVSSISHLWTLDDEAQRYLHVFTEAAWCASHARRHPSGGWILVGRNAWNPLCASVSLVADDGSIVWRRNDVFHESTFDIALRNFELVQAPGDDVHAEVSENGDTALLLLSADPARDTDEPVPYLPVLLRLDEAGDRVSRAALMPQEPSHGSLTLAPAGAAFVAITDLGGDLYLHRVERDGSLSWARVLERQGYWPLYADHLTTDAEGNPWFTVVTGDRDASALHVCGATRTGESLGCFEPPGGLGSDDLPSLVVHEGRVYLEPRATRKKHSIQVCEVSNP